MVTQGKIAGVMAFVSLLVIVCAARVYAQPDVEESVEYYNVYADSSEELVSALNSSSPIATNGKVYYGHTKSQVAWHFNWRHNSDSCWIEGVKVRVQIRYTLPSFQGDDAGARSAWNTWYPNLLAHEKGHRDNAVYIAKEIENSILNMPGTGNCTALEKAANDIGHHLILKLNELDRLYDVRTRHGEIQGADLTSHL